VSIQSLWGPFTIYLERGKAAEGSFAPGAILERDPLGHVHYIDLDHIIGDKCADPAELANLTAPREDARFLRPTRETRV
jgi:hypothetical protein